MRRFTCVSQGVLGLDGQEYIGFLGTRTCKNVPNLVRGWTQAVSDPPNPPALVLAGGKGWDEDIDLAPRQSPHLTVLRPGYLPLEDLPGFLSGCLRPGLPLDRGGLLACPFSRP